MKTKLQPFFPILSIFILLQVPVLSQDNCKVLLGPISEKYQGDCKNGLAHGEGIAIGTDTYKGQFKKGLPDGQGTYVWQNGNRYTGQWKKGRRHGQGKMTYQTAGKDSIVTGRWKNGDFVKQVEQQPYKITSKRSIQRVRIYQNGDRPMIEIHLERHGASKETENLRINNSSGTQNISSSSITIEFPEFPFKGGVYFEAPSKLQTYMMHCEAEFVINEPGRWVVEVYY